MFVLLNIEKVKFRRQIERCGDCHCSVTRAKAPSDLLLGTSFI